MSKEAWRENRCDLSLDLLETGISKQAIQDALYVSAIFQIMNRLADSFDVAVPPPEVFAHSAMHMLERGYYRA